MTLRRRLVNGFRQRLRPPRTLRFTRLGTATVVLAFGLGLAAMNTGNNLLYLVFGMGLGLILASGLISEGILRSLEAEWIMPGEMFADRSYVFRIILRNSGRRSALGVRCWLTIEFPGQGVREMGPTAFLLIPPGGQRAQDIEISPKARGKLCLRQVRLGTTFPFGFFEKSLKRDIVESRVVYPPLVPVPDRLFHQESAEAAWTAPERGPGDSLWGLRDFQEGDNPRRVAWKDAARRGRLVVRETERDTDRRIILSLGTSAEWAPLTPVEQESALSIAASLAVKKWEEGFALGLSAGQVFLTAGRGPHAREELLTSLAVFDPTRAAPARQPVPGAWPVLALWRAWKPR